ncbi:MAG: Ig-like domain repeat protein [Promethearchaeota archaeon]
MVLKNKKVSLNRVYLASIVLISFTLIITLQNFSINLDSRSGDGQDLLLWKTEPGRSTLTNASISVQTDKSWYKNNSTISIFGTLQAVEPVGNLTIVLEIYFESESVPTYTFYNNTRSNGNYEYHFVMSGTAKEGNFTVYSSVLGEPTPVNSTNYYYDGTAPVVGVVTSLLEWMDTNPTLNWSAATDNNVSSSNLTYSIYRAAKLVGETPSPGDYVLINNSVTQTNWTQTGTLTSNRDYHYIISVRDLAGNTANYSSVNTTYDTSKPIISSIISPVENNIYANSLNITARITDSINFTAWAHVSNQTHNSSQINLTASGFNNEYTTIWTINSSYSGPYNLTVYAQDDLGHLRISSNVSFEITSLAPHFSEIMDNAPTYLVNGSVVTRIIEPNIGQTVDTVILYFSVNDLDFDNNVSMNLNGTGNNTDGYWNASLPTYPYYQFGTSGPRTRIYYRIWANNSLGNANISSTYYYDIDDKIAPNFTGLIQTPVPVQFFNNVSVQINVTEPINSSGVDLSIAYLEYWNGVGGNRTNITLSNRGGDKYNALFQSFFDNEKIPASDFNDQIYYRIWAKDQKGNWAHTTNYSYVVQDNDAPRLVSQGLFNAPINYNETGNVYVNFTDVYSNTSTISSGINEPTVFINYTFDGGNSWHAIQMTKFSGGNYSSSWGFNITTLTYNTQVIYKFSIEDNQGNSFNSQNYSYTVVDQIAPTYSNLQNNPASPTYQDAINISIIPSEPLNASGVDHLNLYFSNTSGLQGPFAMINASNTFYYIIPKQDYGQSLNVTIEIFDSSAPTSNKLTISNGLIFNITDTTDPSISGVWLTYSNGSVKTDSIKYYEILNVSVNATDITPGDALPSGINRVELVYRINLGSVNTLVMNLTSGTIYNGTWNAYLPHYDYGTNIQYTIYVYDNAGQVSSQGQTPKDIDDDIKPTFNQPVLVNAPVEYNEESNITITVYEETSPAMASGVSSVTLNYSINSGSWQQASFSLSSGNNYTGSWSVIISYQDYNTSIRYNVIITDGAGNVNTTANYSYIIDDLKSPTINNVTDGGQHYYYENVNVLVNASEDTTPALASGIAHVYLNYSVNGGANTRIEMQLSSGTSFNGVWNATISAQDYNSEIKYNITVVDVDGNFRLSSTNYSYIVDDDVIPDMNDPVHQDTNNYDGNIEYYEEIEITIYIEEIEVPQKSSGVASVTLNYTTDNSTWSQKPMSKKSGIGGIYYGTWNYTFNASVFAWNDTVTYNIIVLDVAGNQNNTGNFTFRVTDLQKPTTSGIKDINAPAMYYKQANITVTISEPALAAGIQNVTLQYSNNSGFTWYDVAAILDNGTIHEGNWSALIPYQDYGLTIQARFLVYDREGNFKLTTPISYIIDDDVNPVVAEIQYLSDCEYWQDNYINLTITEPISPAKASGVSAVYLNYSINGGSQIQLTLELRSGTIRNGTWNATIPKQDYGDVVSFNYTVIDVAGNILLAPIAYSYTVQDHVAPTYSSLALDDDNNHDGVIEYFEHATIRISVQEVTTPTYSSGLFSVTLHYSIDGGLNYTPVAMNLQSGTGNYSGVYNYTFNLMNWNTTVMYYIKILDNSLNEKLTSPIYNYTVKDNVKPTIGTPVTQNAPVMYYENGSVVVQLIEPADASGIRQALVNYTSDNWGTWHSINMTRQNGTIYNGYWNAEIPAHSYDTNIQYRIVAFDQEGNSKLSSIISYTVGDDIAPTVQNHTSSGVFMYYSTVTINVTITEATNGSGIASGAVQLNYAVNSIPKSSLTMTRVLGDNFNGTWQVNISVQDYGSVVTYNFTVSDVALNSIDGVDNDQYTVGDDVLPDINAVSLDDGNDLIIEYDESAEAIIDLSEDVYPAKSSGIHNVTLYYTQDDWLSNSSITMHQKTGIDQWAGTWNCFLPKMTWNTTVKYRIRVEDLAGNLNYSAIYNFTVRDLKTPSLGTPSVENTPIEYDETINISINIQEPVNSSGLQVVQINYSYTANSWHQELMNLSSGTNFNGIWTANLTFYLEYGATFKYEIMANDTANNSIISSQYQFTIDDLDAPTIHDILLLDNGDGLMPIQYFEYPVIKINVSEVTSPNYSSGIDNVRVYYELNSSGSWLLASTVKENFTILNFQEFWNATIPRQDYGTFIKYYVTATDKKGNSVTSTTYNFTISDEVDPTFGTISEANNTYYQNTVVTATVQEPRSPTHASGVNSVNLNVTFNGGVSWLVYSMNLVSGDQFSGAYSVSLPTLAYGTNVVYKILASDNENNTAISSNRSFMILDNRKPEFSMVNQTYTSPNYDDEQIIYVLISEGVNASGVNDSRVLLFYQNSTGTYNVSMIFHSGAGDPYLNDWWVGTIPNESRYDQNITYWIQAHDRAGNFNTSNSFSYVITDVDDITLIDNPSVVNLPVEYDEKALIKLNASEPALASGINFIRLRWRNSTSGWKNVSMSHVSGNEYEAMIPFNDYNTSIEWHVILVDVAGNVLNYSSGANITIVDLTSPVFISYTTSPSPIQANVNTTIYSSFSEPTAASGLNTTYSSAKIYWNRTSSLGPNDTGNIGYMTWNASAKTFDYEMPAARVDETVTFYFEVHDLAGNTLITNTFSYIPNDLSPPTIDNTYFNSTVEYHEELNVTVEASDSGSGVNQVIIFYQVNSTSGSWINVSATLVQGSSASGNWTANIPRQSYNVKIYFWIKAIDGIGREGIDNNSNQYYNSTVVDNTLPVIENIKINGTVPASVDVEYFENANITARIYKSQYPALAAPIVNVTLNYSKSGSWIEIPMSLVSGTSQDGVWSATITSPITYNTIVNFTIYAKDNAGNTTTTSVNSYTIKDHAAPQSSNLSITGSMYYEQITVTIRVYKDVHASNISSVTLYYIVNSSSLSKLMSLINGTSKDGYWRAQIGPFDYGTSISLSVDCVDNAGNSFTSAVDAGSVQIEDDVDPNISSISSPGVVNYYDIVNITTTIEEITNPTYSSGIDSSSVILNYSINGGVNWTSIVMSPTTAFNKFNSTFSAIIPEQDYGTTVQYKVQVKDLAENFIEQLGTSYTVNDSVDPTVTTFGRTKHHSYYHENVIISANISEVTTPKLSSGVSSAALHYRVASGTWFTVVMTMIDGDSYLGNWTGVIPAQNYSLVVEYYITCNDKAGNLADSGFNKTFTIDDDRAPTYNLSPIVTDNNNHDGIIEYNESSVIEFQLYEDETPALASGVKHAILNYSINGSSWTSIQVNSPKNGSRWNGWWNWTISAHAYNTTVTFLVIIRDYEDNENVTGVYSYVVNDTRAPVIDVPTVNEPVTYTSNASITVQVSEKSNSIISFSASGVNRVLVNYSVNGSASVSLNATLNAGNKYNGFWAVNLPAFDWNYTIFYNITVFDNENNIASSTNYNFTIVDVTGPTMGTPNVTNAPIQYYEIALITIEVNETSSSWGTLPAGVTGVWFNYTINNVPQATIALSLISGNIYSGTWRVSLPAQDYGDTINGFFYSDDRDSSGSYSMTTNITFTIQDDIDPQIINVWENLSVINYNDDVKIVARIQDGFGAGTLSSGIDESTDVLIYYKVNNNPWQEENMQRIQGNSHDGNYSFVIPAKAYSSNISYYLKVYDIAGNSIFSGNYSYIVNDTIAPQIGVPTHNAPLYTQYPVIQVQVQEPLVASGISSVVFHYTLNSFPMSDINASLIQGDAFNGNWSVQLSMFDYNDQLNVSFTAKDVEGNEITSASVIITIRDTIKPVIINPTVFNSPITYDEYPIINVRIEEQDSSEGTRAAGVAAVTLYYNATGWNQTLSVAMSRTSGSVYYGDWSATITEFFNWTTTVQYQIVVNDTAGNHQSTLGSFTIYDFDPPVISNIVMTDQVAPFGTVEYNETVLITCRVTDDPVRNTSSGVDLSSVVLYYRFGATGVWNSKLMVNTGGDLHDSTWNVTLSARPYNTTVFYKISASDNAFNEINSSIYNYTTTDLQPPSYSTIRINNQAPQTAVIYYYDSLNFRITAQEDSSASGVSQVRLVYSVNGTARPQENLVRIQGDKYLGVWEWNTTAMNYGTLVNYSFIIVDVEGNSLQTEYYNFTVSDNVNPGMFNLTIINSPVQYDQQVEIRVNVTEAKIPSLSSGIDHVEIQYSYNGGSIMLDNMTGLGSQNSFNRTFQFIIPDKLAWNTDVNFTATAFDKAGNSRSLVGSYTIKDLRNATISTITASDNNNEDGTYEYYESITIIAQVYEDFNASGVAAVYLNYSINNASYSSVSMAISSGNNFDGNWSYTIGSFSYNTTIIYNITVVDLAGNWQNSSNRSIWVDDKGLPVLSTPIVNNGSVVTYLDNIHFVVDVFKPNNSAPLTNVSIVYRINNGSIVTLPASIINVVSAGYNETREYVLSRLNAFDNISYYFYAEDSNGNSKNTTIYPLQIIDQSAPVLESISLNNETNASAWAVSFDETINVTVKLLETDGISNGSGISEVFLYYRSLGTEINYTQVAMNSVAGNSMNGTWYYDVPALQWSGTVFLKIEAHDYTGLEQNYMLYSLTINQTDYYQPDISNMTILMNETAYPGYYDINEDPNFYLVNISVTLSTRVNSSGLNPSKIFVQFKPANESIWINATLIYSGSGNVYSARIHGMKWHQNITYRVYAENNFGVFNVSSQYSYYAVDEKAPSRLADTIGNVIQDAEVEISITLNEPVNASGINESSVNVRFKSSTEPNWTYRALGSLGAGKFAGQIDAYPAGTTVYYQFIYADNANNSRIFPSTPYSYTIGDSKLPIYLDSNTSSNAPVNVSYNTILNFSVFCYDEDSSISSITISYTVGIKPEVLLSDFTQVAAQEYVFSIPGQQWSDSVIKLYVVNITDSSGNTLDVRSSSSRIYVNIIDINKPVLDNSTIKVIEPYQDRSANHSVTINFTAYEPAGAAGLQNVSLIYTNSTNDTVTISQISPAVQDFSFNISDQSPFTRITYYFWIADKAGNVLNTSTTNSTFKLDYFEIRNTNENFTTTLTNPVNTSENIETFNLDPNQNIYIKITEFDSNPQPQGPRFTYHTIVSKVYKMKLNQSGAYMTSAQVIFYYNEAEINASNIDESTLVLAKYTPNGYEPLDNYYLDLDNNKLIFNNTFELQSQLFTLISGYTEYFVILGELKVPVPYLVSPTLESGTTLYGTVIFDIATETYAANVSLYYKIGLGGDLNLIGHNTTAGTSFTITWNTTSIQDTTELILRMVATNPQGFSGINETSSFYIIIQNTPDPTIQIPAADILTGNISLSVNSSIPAASATFFIMTGAVQHVIGVNSSATAWDGYYPFSGNCSFSITWNSTLWGDLDDVRFGANLSSYYGTTLLNGSTLDNTFKTIRNVPDPQFVLDIGFGEYIYGNKTLTAVVTYPGKIATFYYQLLNGTILSIGTNTSADGGYTFIYKWDTSPINLQEQLRLYVNVTNWVNDNGSVQYGNIFNIRNEPVIVRYLEYPDLTQFTGIIKLNVTVLKEDAPMPTRAEFNMFHWDLNTHSVIGVNTSVIVTTDNYYLFEIDWDTRWLLDSIVLLNVTVYNEMGHSVTTSYRNYILKNIPVPVIDTALSGDINSTITVDMHTSPYAADVKYYLRYFNDTTIDLTGNTYSFDNNYTLHFEWETWQLRDEDFVRFGVEMFSLGGYSNGPVYSGFFNLKNLPQPAITTSITAGANLYGNVTVTAYTPLNATNATFYYHDNLGTHEFNMASSGGTVTSPDNKTFTITWHTDEIIPDVSDVNITVLMYSTGGYPNESAPTVNFNLINTPNVTFESVSQYSAGILTGTSVQIIVNSTNYGTNATLYCTVSSVGYQEKVGTVVVTSLNESYYFASFTWDSLAFTKNLLATFPTEYDPVVYFTVDMTNAKNVNGSANSSNYNVYNTPSMQIEIPATIINNATINITNSRSYITTTSAAMWFYNGSQLINISMSSAGFNSYRQWYDFEPIMDNASAVFYFQLVTDTGIIRTTSVSPIEIKNIPDTTIVTSLSGDVTGTISVVINAMPYAANSSFHLQYLNGTIISIDTHGSVTSPDNNYTIIFNWDTWNLRDENNVRFGVELFSKAGYSNGVTWSSLFNLKNLPQPVITTSIETNSSLYGNITITAFSPIEATNATFYYHAVNGSFIYKEFNENFTGGTVTSPDNKTFTIIWQTGNMTELNNIYVTVVMHSLGGYPNESAPSNLFNLENRPNVQFEFVSQQLPGVVSGSSVTIRINSSNAAVNATLHVFAPEASYSEIIGIENVTCINSSYYRADFTWNSISFTQTLLSINSTLYDPQIYFFVEMKNIYNKTGTKTSMTYSLLNTPGVSIEIPSKISNDVIINVTNPRPYVNLWSVHMWFNNGTSQINISMNMQAVNSFSIWYDFTTIINENTTFYFLLEADTGIQRRASISNLEINNVPEPFLVNNGTLAAYPSVLSGNTTFIVNSSVAFTSAEFYIRYNGMNYLMDNSTLQSWDVSNHSHWLNLTFDSLNFTRANGLPADIEGLSLIIYLYNYRGEFNSNITSGYVIYNAPFVQITVAPVVSGSNVTIIANNTRSFIDMTKAYFSFHNGYSLETVEMQDSGNQFITYWDSTYVCDNNSFSIIVTIESDLGVNGTGVVNIKTENGIDFLTFMPKDVLRVFDLTLSNKYMIGKMNLNFSIIADEDSYLRIEHGNETLLPSTLPAANNIGDFYLFDNDSIFNFTLFDKAGKNVGLTMNVTFYYSVVKFTDYNNLYSLDLNQSSVQIVKFNGSGYEFFPDSGLNLLNYSFTITNIHSLSVFFWVVQENKQLPQIDILSMVILIALIGAVISIATIATRPKVEKEQIIPGKKKTCKRCGKYVKPYMTVCPYCGNKLTDEESLADAMNKLRHLFIFHEESGVCLYYHAFTDTTIDPQLISGFLTAITSFGTQFDDINQKKKGAGPESKSSDLKELVYKEYRILMETSGACKFAVLIQGQSSKILSFKISQFIKHFMRTYGEVLQEWKGNVRMFKDVGKMVRLIFGLTKVQSKAGSPGSSQPTQGSVASMGAVKPTSIPPKQPAAQKPLVKQPQAPGAATQPAAPKPPVSPQHPPPMKPTPPTQQQTSKAASIFKIKEGIMPGKPPASPPSDEDKKSIFSPKMPPELDKSKKKKKK